jgi:radical SAM protein with 4Fe4S-binding SPASM domain
MVQNNYFYIAQSEFWAYYLNSRHAKYLLKKNIEKTLRKDIFNEYVASIVLETSAFCNRRCSYCPVSFQPRQQHFMDEELFVKILEEMRQIDYRGMFVLSLFNEPLADRDILKRIRTVKEYCPNSYVRMNSNGDYLTKEFLEELNLAGLSEILITCHMNGSEIYTDLLAAKKIDDFFEKMGLEYKITSKIEGHNISCDYIYKNIRMLVVTNNWSEDGNDRGGKVKQLSIENRIQPCVIPFREVAIDVEGNVRFCWNFFVDTDFVGNVRDMSVLDIYFGDEMVDSRRNHLSFVTKDLPCATCRNHDNAREESAEFRRKLLDETEDTD